MSNSITILAVLKAKAGKNEALKQALQALIHPTRQEPGNITYQMHQLRDAPEMFYVYESWHGQEGLDTHIALPHFQAFIARMDDLLAEPLRLDYLQPLEG